MIEILLSTSFSSGLHFSPSKPHFGSSGGGNVGQSVTFCTSDNFCLVLLYDMNLANGLQSNEEVTKDNSIFGYL